MNIPLIVIVLFQLSYWLSFVCSVDNNHYIYRIHVTSNVDRMEKGYQNDKKWKIFYLCTKYCYQPEIEMKVLFNLFRLCTLVIRMKYTWYYLMGLNNSTVNILKYIYLKDSWTVKGPPHLSVGKALHTSPDF